MIRLTIGVIVATALSAQIVPLPDQGGAFTNANAQTINSNFSYISNALVSVIQQGAKADVQLLLHCTTNTGSKTVNCSDAHFSPADVGKGIAIQNGVSSTHNLYTTIASASNTNVISTTAPVLNGLTDIHAVFGTDNVQAFNTTVALRKSFSIPSGGGYYISGPVSVNYPEFIFGGAQQTSIYCMFDGATTGFTFDALGGSPVNSLYTGWQVGMSNILLIGPGYIGNSGVVGSSAAIQLGGSINAIGAKLENVTALYFHTCLTIADNSYYNLVSGSFFADCVTDLHMTTAVTGNGESTKFLNTPFQNGGPDWGMTDMSDCIKVDGVAFMWSFDSLSFVNCQVHFTSTAGGKFVFNQIHQEEPSGTSTQDEFVIDSGAGSPQLTFYSPDIILGRPSDGSGPLEWATLSSGIINIYDGNFDSYKLAPFPTLIKTANAAQIKFYGTYSVYSRNIANYFSGAASTSGGPSYIQPDPTIVTATSSLTANQAQETLYCGSSGAWTFTALPFTGQRYLVINKNSGAVCTVTGNSGTIDGSATYDVPASGTQWFVWSGSQWYKI